jgi:hypothetical protein
MREKTSRASVSPPNRKTPPEFGSMAPGSASFMIGYWPSGLNGAMVPAKIAENSQKPQMKTPAMPTPVSRIWP